MPPLSPEEVERKVHQHDNDIAAIYEIVTRVETTQRRHTERFDQVDARFDRIDARLDQHDARFDQVDAKFEQVDLKLDEILRRLEP